MAAKIQRSINKKYIPYRGIISEDQIAAGIERFKQIIRANRQRAIELTQQQPER